jgi:hypothetical protein
MAPPYSPLGERVKIKVALCPTATLPEAGVAAIGNSGEATTTVPEFGVAGRLLLA